MGFEWDAGKNESNVAKHGIDFVDAIRMFDGPVLEQVDDRRDYGETRMIAYGAVRGREIVVVYAVRGEKRRIISARRAHKNEREAYREAYPADASSRRN